MIIAGAENEFTQPRPFTRRQFKSARWQRIPVFIPFELQASQAERAGDVFFEVRDCRSSTQFPAQQLAKNLEMTRPVNEARARWGQHDQSNRHSVTIGNRFSMEERRL